MERKRLKYAWIKVIVLLIIIILLKIGATQTEWVERYYSSFFYQQLSLVLRFITGWIPFSLGDILYCLVIVWLIIRIVKTFRYRKEKFSLALIGYLLANFFSVVFKVYIFFMLLWGLNYYRSGISYQLHLQPKPYNTDELKELTIQLIQKVNSAKENLKTDTGRFTNSIEIFNTAKKAYTLARKEFSFLEYKNQSVKKSFFGTLCNYPGFLGYYNPFTGEAQVNATVPVFTIPYTTCHEMAHQLGYASESEANFVGYLVATRSNNNQFIYSAFLDLFEYANSELYYRDSVAARSNYKQLDTLVKKDMIDYRNFFKRYENAVEPIVNIFYDNYLKANNQTEGIESYSQVIEWLIAYRNKYGKL